MTRKTFAADPLHVLKYYTFTHNILRLIIHCNSKLFNLLYISLVNNNKIIKNYFRPYDSTFPEQLFINKFVTVFYRLFTKCQCEERQESRFLMWASLVQTTLRRLTICDDKNSYIGLKGKIQNVGLQILKFISPSAWKSREGSKSRWTVDIRRRMRSSPDIRTTCDKKTEGFCYVFQVLGKMRRTDFRKSNEFGC